MAMAGNGTGADAVSSECSFGGQGGADKRFSMSLWPHSMFLQSLQLGLTMRRGANRSRVGSPTTRVGPPWTGPPSP
eukprot:12341088-Alexandrium_andersonii.AAC.1